MQGVSGFVLVGVCLIGTLESATLSSSVQNSIETRVVVDSWAFNRWKSKVATSTTESEKNKETQTALVNYVYSVFNDLNSIYKELLSSGINLDARIVSIEIITDEEITSENPVGSGQGRSETVLPEFRTWLAAKGYPSPDHTMLLTGLDLTKNGSTSNAGKAYVGLMCHPKLSLSVSEATPSSSAIITVAHELGHSLNAEHDRIQNSCSGGYIMAPSQDLAKGSSTNFRFSSCSIYTFEAYLQTLQNGDSCLSAANTNTDTVSAPPLGERYTPDDICKMVMGSTSYFCRNLYGYDEDRVYTSMCSIIFCKQTNSTQCISVRGSDGFVCGQGKKCYLGDCKASDTAPTSVTDLCPQGDTPGSVNDQGQTCSQAVTAFPGNCYTGSFRRECCATCAAAATTNTNCEFGDKAEWCADGTYPYYCNSNGEACCGTCQPLETGIAGCKYGDKAEWCAGFIAENIDNCKLNSGPCCKSCANYGNGNAPTSTTQKPADTTEKPAATTTTASTVTTSASGSTCSDGTTQCGSAIADEPYLCYVESNEQLCCASCASAKIGTTGCEYGDKANWCTTLQYPTGCYVNDAACCASCSSHHTGMTGCEYGDKSSGCATLTYPRDCYDNDDVCCQSCSSRSTGIAGCKYGDKSSGCSTLNYPRDCYDNDDVCCQSCSSHSTGITGCEYGDKNTQCSSVITTWPTLCGDAYVSNLCCSSCAM